MAATATTVGDCGVAGGRDDGKSDGGGSKDQSLRTTSRTCCFASRIAASRLSFTAASEMRGLRWREGNTEEEEKEGLEAMAGSSKGGSKTLLL